MHILAVGINHKTSPLDIREKFHLSCAEREWLLSDLKSDPAVIEAFVLSTCNRTEIYAGLLEGNPGMLLKALSKVKKISLTEDLRRHFYCHEGEEAVRHLLSVSAGLDSLILGEKQILGQLKDAVELSRSKGMMGKQFNILSNIAIRTGKKARHETPIDCGGSSVSWAAVSMAQKLLGSLEDKSILIIGTGKMGELAANHLKQKGARRIFIMNRTYDKAVELTRRLGGVPVSFWDMKSLLERVDVCVCSAGSPHYIVTKDLTEEALKQHPEKRLICIDISVPRNIEPGVAAVDGVTLVTIDDLDKVVEDNAQKRLGAVVQVEQIVAQKTREFYGKLQKASAAEEAGFFEAGSV